MDGADQILTPVAIHALGRFEVLVHDEPLRFVFKAPRKPLDLLKGLLISGGDSVGQHTLCEALWPDLDSWSAGRALNTAVFRLRKLLGDKSAIRVDCGQIRAREPVLPGRCLGIRGRNGSIPGSGRTVERPVAISRTIFR